MKRQTLLKKRVQNSPVSGKQATVNSGAIRERVDRREERDNHKAQGAGRKVSGQFVDSLNGHIVKVVETVKGEWYEILFVIGYVLYGKYQPIIYRF